MVSLIICSKNPQLNPVLRENIANTIGCEYEIVHIDNSQNAYNIFQAYNLGVERAKGEFLCFMHEDICFHNTGWGKTVENYLSLSFVGALCVAGSNIIPNIVDWRFCDFTHHHLIQSTTSAFELSNVYCATNKFQMPKYDQLMLVAILDGVFMCMRSSLFKQIHFDDVNFHGFHHYDSDICLQIDKLGYGIFVTQSISLEHYSMGCFSSEYLQHTEIFAKKWKHQLPLVIGTTLSPEDFEAMQQEALQRFHRRLAHDQEIIRLKQLLRNGTPTKSLSSEDLAFMDHEAYHFRRLCIKDQRISTQQVKSLMKSYTALPYANKRMQLIAKYIWYRILHYRLIKM